ncbi:MAG: cation transporter [Thermoanaerobaculum sp.]|nr:cation transporter [Thermoanaerobaculum sp.]MDW7968687.1 cation transporter [Thermoanaerobaculum sp.]
MTQDQGTRERLLGAAWRLELFTLGWNIAEGVVAVLAAIAAKSPVLLGFGVDSFVESTSALVLLWRLGRERRGLGVEPVEAVDRKAEKLVALSLLLLAGYVAWEAVRALRGGEIPQPSVVGIALTSLSLVVMVLLARAKRRLAKQLGSGALAADAVQTTACWWLSSITLAGLALNATFGWWWADPLAALGVCVYLVREAWEHARGEQEKD